MKKTVLREYAKLIAKVGANVQKGQEVFITADNILDFILINIFYYILALCSQFLLEALADEA